jgi:hypothetical protein
MKRFAPLILALCSALVLVAPVQAKDKKERTPGIELATMASQVTGIAISPLLGVGAVGAYQYFGAETAEEKARLPWFAQVSFWLPALLLVGVCAFKDTIAAVAPPGWKKPLDVAETLENKVSGLVAAGAVIPSLVALGSKMIMDSSAVAPSPVVVNGLGMLPIGAFDMSWLLTVLMVPLSIAVFAVVWIVGHAINVLILLSPWGAVDTALKGIRTAVLSLVAGTAFIDPVVGATLSVVIILLAYLTAGSAFRLMVIGSVFSWDFFTIRRRRFQLLADGNKLFTGRQIGDAPIRSYGRLYQSADGKLLFRFRPWLVMREREIEVPREGLVVGEGMFYSEVLGFDARADKNATLLLLPPRYLGHEEMFARTYRISGTCEIGLRRAWGWLKEALGFRSRKAAAAV